MIKFFKQLFKHENRIEEISSMPEWDKIVEIMYDKNLDSYADDIIKVIYSKDKSKRYLLTKNIDGLYKYSFETIIQYDIHEWQYMGSYENALPAMWVPTIDDNHHSFFESEADALKELNTEPNFRRYFE